MKIKISAFFLFCSLLPLFLIGLLAPAIWRYYRVACEKQSIFVPEQINFKLSPPNQALVGRVVSKKGLVKIEPREGKEWETIIVDRKIIEGDRLAVGLNSRARIDFNQFTTLNLGADSEVGLVNLLTSGFLVKQSTGKVDYQLRKTEDWLAVRCLNTLISLSGQTEVEVINDLIIVRQATGQAKLALVDYNNQTKVWSLKEGQAGLVYNGQRWVEIR